LQVLNNVRQSSGNSVVLNAVTKEIRQRVELIEDKEKQQRINALVKDLLARIKKQPARVKRDEWTSLPLTLWTMDLEVQGIPPKEGEEKILLSAFQDRLLQENRIQLVERALLDTLLKELKLGSSELTDKRTALSLGKILAARLILSGRLTYQGPDTIVSMRLIETQTGKIMAAENHEFDGSTGIAQISEKLASSLAGKITAAYPLQGKVTEVSNEHVTINIGKSLGVKPDLYFKDLYDTFSLKVISVGERISMASVSKGNPDVLQPGLQLLEVIGQK